MRCHSPGISEWNIIRTSSQECLLRQVAPLLPALFIDKFGYLVYSHQMRLAAGNEHSLTAIIRTVHLSRNMYQSCNVSVKGSPC
jgi:hypothetical protein